MTALWQDNLEVKGKKRPIAVIPKTKLVSSNGGQSFHSLKVLIFLQLA